MAHKQHALALLCVAVAALSFAERSLATTNAGPVLVTGATGQTGSLLYEALKSRGIQVRGFVRSAAKAQEKLSCGECTRSDGIFVGDVTKRETLVDAMAGVKQLVILTSSFPQKLPNGSFYFPEGAYPKDIDWLGSNNQVRAALDAGVDHILMVSSMGTTEPNSFLDLLGNGHVLFYKLNGEIDLMGSGAAYTIVKPGGLLNEKGGQSLLLAGHNDDLAQPRVPRADVAEVLLQAILMPELSKWTRFDLSTDSTKPATGDFEALFEAASDWRGPASKSTSLQAPFHGASATQ